MGVRDRVLLLEEVRESVPEGVPVREAVRLPVGVRDCVLLPVEVLEGVTEGVQVTEGDTLGVAVGVCPEEAVVEELREMEGVGLEEAVGERLGTVPTEPSTARSAEEAEQVPGQMK